MRKASALNLIVLALGIAFLYLPIVILMIYSFNASRLVAATNLRAVARTSVEILNLFLQWWR